MGHEQSTAAPAPSIAGSFAGGGASLSGASMSPAGAAGEPPAWTPTGTAAQAALVPELALYAEGV